MKYLIGLTLSIAIFLFASVRPGLAESITVSATVDTVLILQGYTSPSSLVVFLENDSTKGTTTSNSSGFFEKSFNSQDPGIHTIGIYSTDPDNINTLTVSLEILLIQNQTIAVSDIYLPPTINISSDVYLDNENISVYGYSASDSLIKVKYVGLNSIIDYEQSQSNGYYINNTPAGDLGAGEYEVTSSLQATISNTSTVSEILTFTIDPAPTPTPGSDATTTTPTASEQGKSTDSDTTSSPSPSPTPLLCPYEFVNLCFFDKDNQGFIDVQNLSFIDFLIQFSKNFDKPIKLAVDLNNNNLIDAEDLSIFFYHVRGKVNDRILGITLNRVGEYENVLGLSTQRLDNQVDRLDNGIIDILTNPSIRLIFNLILIEIIVGIPFFIVFLYLIIITKNRGKNK